VVAVLVVAGVVAAVALTGGSKKQAGRGGTRIAHTLPPGSGTNASIQDGVGRLAAIVDLSQQGRTATINGDFTTAIANRQQVLDKLDTLTVPPQLELSRRLLRQSVQASLMADQRLAQCTTCPGTLAANRRATALKQAFVSAFNPWATKYLRRSFDANSL
jgi:hypothetical protein